MKYYYIEIEERNGEQEYRQPSSVAIDGRKNIEKYADDLAKGWYGGSDEDYTEPEKDGDTYYHLGGTIAISVGRIKEITKDEYDVLKKFCI